MDQIFVVLLVKLAVAASFASILSRSRRFQNLLLNDERGLIERVWLSVGIAAACGGGATARILTQGAYKAVDLSLEGSFVAGLLGGYVPGLLSGVLISIPSMANGEYLSMAVYAAAGVMGALLRDLAATPADLWRFSPFLDVSLWRLVRHRQDRRRNLHHLAVLGGVALAELLRQTVMRLFQPHNLFTLYGDWEPGSHPLLYVAVYATTVFAVALPIKIWANARNERMLEAKERLLVEARLRALSSQINPHFLFNTLNTVSALIRTDPDQARRVVYRLSHILRRLLKKTEGLSPLKEELEFIDDYLSIEVVRFGDKLRVTRDVAGDTLNCPVPSMLLQPIVENSIKHGLAPKVEGGEIRIESRLRDGRLVLAVSDDGVGIAEERLAEILTSGIGVSNVNERLKVLFGDSYELRIDSQPGEGTRTEIELPAGQESMTP